MAASCKLREVGSLRANCGLPVRESGRDKISPGVYNLKKDSRSADNRSLLQCQFSR